MRCTTADDAIASRTSATAVRMYAITARTSTIDAKTAAITARTFGTGVRIDAIAEHRNELPDRLGGIERDSPGQQPTASWYLTTTGNGFHGD